MGGIAENCNGLNVIDDDDYKSEQEPTTHKPVEWFNHVNSEELILNRNIVSHY